MELKEFCLNIDRILDIEPGTTTGSEALADAELFDSLGMLEVIVLLDEDFNLEMTPEEINEYPTLLDLYTKISN
jgi:acyl carrier protein